MLFLSIVLDPTRFALRSTKTLPDDNRFEALREDDDWLP